MKKVIIESIYKYPIQFVFSIILLLFGLIYSLIPSSNSSIQRNEYLLNHNFTFFKIDSNMIEESYSGLIYNNQDTCATTTYIIKKKYKDAVFHNLHKLNFIKFHNDENTTYSFQHYSVNKIISKCYMRDYFKKHNWVWLKQEKVGDYYKANILLEEENIIISVTCNLKNGWVKN